MTHPGVYVVMLGVAVGVAIYTFINSSIQPERPYTRRNNDPPTRRQGTSPQTRRRPKLHASNDP